MSVEPKVSILLPTHNGERFIRRAIDSVRAQTFTEWELIVINDGSTDKTGALVTEIKALDPRIKMIIFEKNKGIQKALNEGLLQAKAPLVARLDDDDLWTDTEKLSKQLRRFEEEPTLVLLGTGVIVQDEEGRALYNFRNPETDSEIRKRILYRNCFSHSSVMFKRSLALSCGGYSEHEQTLHIEDYELWLRLGRHGKMANLPDLSLAFTVRADAISGKHKLEQLWRQLEISRVFRADYPNYPLSRIQGYARFIGYKLFGHILPKQLLTRLIARYKQN